MKTEVASGVQFLGPHLLRRHVAFPESQRGVAVFFSEHWNTVLNLEHLNFAMAEFVAEGDECLPLFRGHNFRSTVTSA